MKILFVAPASDFTHQLHTALEQEGNLVTYVNDRSDYTLPSFLRGFRGLWRLTRRIPWWRARANRALQQEILRLAETSNCEVLIASKGMNITPDTLAWFRKRDIRSAVWFGDNAAKEPYRLWVLRVGPLWDHFFSFDASILTQLPSTGHAKPHTLSVAVDPAVFELQELSAEDHRLFDCQVCFIGAVYPERVKILEQVQDLDLKIFGWPGWKKTSLARFYHGPLNGPESVRAYRCAQISVNMNARPFARGLNLKTFEICASRGFQLSDVPPDLYNFFEPEREVATFSPDATFRDRVRYWLNHSDQRHRIADAGYARVVRDHTMRNRVREMLRIIEKPPSRS